MSLLRKLLLVTVLAVIALLTAVLYLYRQASPGVPVLNYHQINDTEQNSLTVNTEQFTAQMEYLAANGYHTISPEELLRAWRDKTPLPDNPVIITFDDGYVDNYRYAFPILRQYGFKGTIFLITDYVNTYPNYLTWNEAREMQDSGIIDFESHTLSHMELSAARSEEEIRHELQGSKEAIRWHLGKEANFIAYPCGTFNDTVKRLTEEAGYRGAFTVSYGLTEPDEEFLVMDRIPIFGSNNHTLLRFKLRMRLAPLLEPLTKIKSGLNRNGHEWLAGLIVIP